MDIPKIAYKDFLINQKEPTRDSRSYIPFWQKHIDYCKSGVIVGGIHISGWLYWHINFFKVKQHIRDEYGNDRRKVLPTKLRDNEWYLEYHLKKAKSLNNTPIISFGTRRYAKSVIMTSKVSYSNFIMKDSSPLIIGGSNADLNNITKYFSEFYQERQDCFSDIIKVGDWNKATSSDVRFEFNRQAVTKGKNEINPISFTWFPLKEKKNERSFLYTTISIRNLEHGQVSTKEELLAGLTPSEAIWDEIGKYKYNRQRAALLPAIMNDLGERSFVELLMGTGGSIEHAEDAQADFLYTEKSKFLYCDPEEYKLEVKPEYFQYTQTSDKKVGLFVPAQMSLAGGQKKEIPLSEYLNREFTKEQLKDLEGFNIWVTDWENAETRVRELIAIEYAKSSDEGRKAQMYYPFQPEECFLDLAKNPFPVEEARKRQAFIKEKGLTGEYVELSSGPSGTIEVTASNLEPVTQYPFKGGAYDAPIVIYERPIFNNPRQIKHGTYVAGFDGTKITVSNVSDSLNALYIHKRVFGVSGYRDQIVACYVGRPNMDSHYYRQCMLLLKLYNAECLPESDVNFTKYLRLNNAEYLLAASKGTNLRINSNSVASTENGLPSNTRTKQHVLKLLKDYCWDEIDTGDRDEDGNPIRVRGIHRIPDPMLLEEIATFGGPKNYDRIMAYGHALIWDEELSINSIVGSEKQMQIAIQQDKVRNGSLGRNHKYMRRSKYRR